MHSDVWFAWRLKDLKKQQEEMRQKQQEEKALREAEMAKKREEQRATLVVRRAIQKARVATPENHEESLGSCSHPSSNPTYWHSFISFTLVVDPRS